MKIDSQIWTIRKLYADKYRAGDCLKGALWPLWLRTGMSRVERLRHLCVMLEVKAENANENQKRLYRWLYRRLLKIENETIQFKCVKVSL